MERVETAGGLEPVPFRTRVVRNEEGGYYTYTDFHKVVLDAQGREVRREPLPEGMSSYEAERALIEKGQPIYRFPETGIRPPEGFETDEPNLKEYKPYR